MAITKNPSNLAFGYLCGAVMAVGASISFASARAGILAGLTPDDMIFARFVVAGLLLLPFLVWWGLTTLAGIGWPRGLALLLTGGPLFGLLQTGGYAFAPLAHSAVIAPSIVTILSTIAAAAFLGESSRHGDTKNWGLAINSHDCLLCSSCRFDRFLFAIRSADFGRH